MHSGDCVKASSLKNKLLHSTYGRYQGVVKTKEYHKTMVWFVVQDQRVEAYVLCETSQNSNILQIYMCSFFFFFSFKKMKH